MIKSIRPVLIATFIILGFASLISQTICVRELLVIFFGNEVCLGIIFTVWLIGITLGALIGAYIADKLKSHLGIIVGLLILMALILPSQIYLIRILRYALDIPSGQHLPFTAIVYAGLILVTPFSFLIGLIFPLACRIYTTTDCDPAVQIGWVYVLEAVGSLLGGVIFTFYLVEHFQPFTIAFITNILLLMAAFAISWFGGLKLLKPLTTLLLVINIVILFLASDAINQSSIQKRWHSFNSQIKLAESVDSKYGNIAIGTLQDQYNLFENGKYVAAFPDDYTYAPLANFFLTEHPDPQDILLIGGGLEGLIKEMLKHPIKSLHYVQIDPKLIETVYNYLPEIDREIIKNAIGDGRLQIHYQDGRRFIKATQSKFDMVIVNLPDPSTALLNRFYTIDFFNEAKAVLKPNGVFVTRSSSAVNYFSETIGNYLGSVYDSMKSVFKHIIVTPGTESYLFATDSDGIITFDINTLDARFKKRNVQSDYFISPAWYEMMLEKFHIDLTLRSLEERTQKYLNTDLKPVTYFFNLVLWDAIASDDMASKSNFFADLGKIKFSWIIIGLVVLLIVRLLRLADYSRLYPAVIRYRSNSRSIARLVYVLFTRHKTQAHQQFNSLAAIFAIGLAGLSLELVIIFAYQNIYGYIYQRIGLIVALFMLGLALGGLICNRTIMNNRHTPKSPLNRGDFGQSPPERGRGVWSMAKWLIIIEVIIALFALTLPYFITLITTHTTMFSEYLVFLMVVISGFLTGFVYPIVNKLHLLPLSSTPSPTWEGNGEGATKVGKTAGLVDSFDHLGACLGALVTGIVLVPIFGLSNTCLFVALLNLIPAVLLLVTLLTRRNEQD